MPFSSQVLRQRKERKPKSGENFLSLHYPLENFRPFVQNFLRKFLTLFLAGHQWYILTNVLKISLLTIHRTEQSRFGKTAELFHSSRSSLSPGDKRTVLTKVFEILCPSTVRWRSKCGLAENFENSFPHYPLEKIKPSGPLLLKFSLALIYIGKMSTLFALDG